MHVAFEIEFSVFSTVELLPFVLVYSRNSTIVGIAKTGKGQT